MNVEQLLQQANAYLSQGKTDQALDACQQALRQHPNFAPAYQLLGNICEVREEWTEAMHAYVKTTELQPQWAEPYAYLARLYRTVGWLDEAISFYQKASGLWHQPPPELYYALGEALHKKGEFVESIQYYQQAIAHNSQYILPYLGWAIVLNEQGNIDAAITLLKQTITQIPTATAAYNTLGCLLLKQDQLIEAQTVLEQALAQQPHWVILHNNLGQVFAAQGKTGQAITAYQNAIKLQPDLTLAYSNLAKLWQRQNQHCVAVGYFQKVIELEPESKLAYSDCANSLLMQGKFAEAMPYLKQAVVLEPKFVEAYYQQFGAVSISEAADDELLMAQITCAQFLRILHQSNFTQSNFNNSNSNLEQVTITQLPTSEPVSSDPESSRLCQLLAKTYFHLGNTLAQYEEFERGIFYYQKALYIQPQFLEIFWRLSYCLLQQNRWDAALVVANLAQTLAESCQQFSPEIDLLLGLILEQQQQEDSAINYYEKVLQSFQKSDRQTTIHPLVIQWINAATVQNSNSTPKLQGICSTTLNWLETQTLDATHYYSIEISQDIRLTVLNTISKTSIVNHSDASDSSSNCLGLDCSPCLERIFKQLELTNLGHGIQTCLSQGNSGHSTEKAWDKTLKTLESTPTLFVAKVPNGRAWIVPQENYWRVCKAIAIITPDDQLLADVSREYPGQLPGCQKYSPEQHQIFRVEQLPELTSIDGSVAVLSGLSGHIYFHWMVDILPRIQLLRWSGIDFNQIDCFLVNSCHLDFQQETLTQLGIPNSKILTSDRHPHIQAQTLIIPSFAGPLGWLQPWAVDFLRQSFLTSIHSQSATFPERIYISRADAKHRKVLNEKDVMQVLQLYNFISFQLEDLSFAQQVALFSQAKVIIAPHGSGLTNLVFCQPNVKVIELISPHYHRHYYWVISQCLGLEHYTLTGEGFSCYPLRQLMYQNPLTEDIWVNLTSLKILLGKAGIVD
ncbi:MAG: tetratricopeptide repeat protein [Microcoleaceae cyanobacterium]